MPRAPARSPGNEAGPLASLTGGVATPDPTSTPGLALLPGNRSAHWMISAAFRRKMWRREAPNSSWWGREVYELMLAYGCWWGKMLFELLIRQGAITDMFTGGPVDPVDLDRHTWLTVLCRA